MNILEYADVAELVDAPDLGSGAARCESSSLSVRTILSLKETKTITFIVVFCRAIAKR